MFSQSFQNIENKEVFYPEPVRAESTHSYDVLHYLINLNLPMTSRYLAGAVTIAMRSNIDNLNQIDLYLSGLNVDSIKVDAIPATYNHIADTLFVNLPQIYNQGDSFNVMVGYSGTASGSMGYLWYQSLHPISYTLGCPFAEKRWFPAMTDYGTKQIMVWSFISQYLIRSRSVLLANILARLLTRVLLHTTGNIIIQFHHI